MKTILSFWKVAGVLALAAWLSAGCATKHGVRASTRATFARTDVPAAVRDKVDQAQPLTVTEVASALEGGVPEAALLDYIRESRSVYQLGTAEVDRLRAVPASDAFIDQLLATPAQAATARNPGYIGVYRAPYPRYYGYGRYGGYYPGGHYRGGYGRGYYGGYGGYGYRCY